MSIRSDLFATVASYMDQFNEKMRRAIELSDATSPDFEALEAAARSRIDLVDTRFPELGPDHLSAATLVLPIVGNPYVDFGLYGECSAAVLHADGRILKTKGKPQMRRDGSYNLRSVGLGKQPREPGFWQGMTTLEAFLRKKMYVPWMTGKRVYPVYDWSEGLPAWAEVGTKIAHNHPDEGLTILEIRQVETDPAAGEFKYAWPTGHGAALGLDNGKFLTVNALQGLLDLGQADLIAEEQHESRSERLRAAR